MLARALACRRRSLITFTGVNRRQGIRVLALESSADDTCAAVVEDEKVLSNIVIKQHAINAQYGGIYPYAALEAHQKNMAPIRSALSESGTSLSELDGIAFTRGPGMGGCLGVCTNAGKAIAAALDKPIVGVHHMQAHALTALFTSPKDSPVRFPFVTLLISGGHTMLVLATSFDSFEILADTRDAAVGRAFDKVARSLEIEGGNTHLGAALEHFCCAEEGASSSKSELKFSRCMPGKLAFSYGGLHSQVDRYLEQHGGVQNLDVAHRKVVARAFQEAASEQLAEKLKLALEQCSRRGIHVQNVVASGGVASNSYIRRKLHDVVKQYEGVGLNFPPPALCTDNAVMIGWASLHRFRAETFDDYRINPMSKWSIEDLSHGT
ncbi:glycoprotease family-domain-containing protein [Schizophyllum fasciatum]